MVLAWLAGWLSTSTDWLWVGRMDGCLGDWVAVGHVELLWLPGRLAGRLAVGRASWKRDRVSGRAWHGVVRAGGELCVLSPKDHLARGNNTRFPLPSPSVCLSSLLCSFDDADKARCPDLDNAHTFFRGSVGGWVLLGRLNSLHNSFVAAVEDSSFNTSGPHAVRKGTGHPSSREYQL